MKRILSIDFVRGLVMIIMALDHIRDTMHFYGGNQDPTDLETTTPGLFMTRWITHLCAPTFVFLSGTSAYLSMKNQEDFNKNRRFLFKRGLWLILLNFTVVNFGIFFDPTFSVLFLQVIAAIGFGFVGLALLLKLSPRTLGIIGLIIIFGHDLFNGISFTRGTLPDVVWFIMMSSSFYPITPDFGFLTSYPLIPWLGVMLAGYGCGELFNEPSEKRKKVFFRIGVGSILLFVGLRTFNIYGDVAHWSFQKNTFFSFFSFINVSKYPPSLLFTLITLGISFLLLSAFDSVNNATTDIISVYGKVPLFYYMIHWFVIHIVAIVVYFSLGYQWSDLQFEGFGFGRPKENDGLHLPTMYVVWLGIVIFLYPFCKWYSTYKSQHKEKTWLRYL